MFRNSPGPGTIVVMANITIITLSFAVDNGVQIKQKNCYHTIDFVHFVHEVNLTQLSLRLSGN